MLLASALKSTDPPADAALVPFYVEALAVKQDADVRARVCRAITHADGATRRYATERIPFYIEAVCSYPDDEKSVLYVLALLSQQVINAQHDLPFSQGVYAAALYYTRWEHSISHKLYGLPPYTELRRELAALYVIEPDTRAPERTSLVEMVYADLVNAPDAASRREERLAFARYLVRIYRAEGRDDSFAQAVLGDVARSGGDSSAPAMAARYDYDVDDDPLDDPEAILRGGNGSEIDDQRIAIRYIEENRPFDAAACSLFVRMVRYAEDREDESDASFWTVKLAQALIAVGRVDEDTRDVLRTASSLSNDPNIELGYLYGMARDRAGDVVTGGDADLARRLERLVIEKSSVYKPLAERKRWDWATLERALALCWGHKGRTDAAARALYKQVVDNNPDDRMLVVLYARALAQAQVYDKSVVSAYERALDLGKANEPVRKALARAYAKTGAAKDKEKRSRAMLLWEELFTTGGMADDPDITAALADAYVIEDRGGEIAIALWEKRCKVEPKNGRIRLLLAREYRKRDDITSAVRVMKEAVKLLPDDFEAQLETGTLLHEQGDDANAVKYLKKAVALPEGENNRDACFALAEVLFLIDKRDEARPLFERIVGVMDPNHAPTLRYLAQMNLRQDPTGARKAASTRPTLPEAGSSGPDAQKRMATQLLAQGRYAEAEAALEKYMSQESGDSDVARQLADIYIRRGDFIKAEASLRQTVALGGGDKKLFGLLGEMIVKAQQQRDGEIPPPTPVFVPQPAAEPIPQPAPVFAQPVYAVPAPMAAPAPIPAPDVAQPGKLPRQSLITRSTVPPEPDSPPAPPKPPVETPASQNLTRSVGAAAIKAALRNRAARLAAASPDGPSTT